MIFLQLFKSACRLTILIGAMLIAFIRRRGAQIPAAAIFAELACGSWR